MVQLITILLSVAAIGYAFFLKRDEERRQEWRQASRAIWSNVK